jgi:hypothetical protein
MEDCQALLRRVLCWLLLLSAGAVWAAPSVALFYAAKAPLDELHAFDIVVVDPDHGADPLTYNRGPSQLYAYVSVGEVSSTRTWFKDIPAAWCLTGNDRWGSTVLDLAQPQWTEFVVDRIVAPLWARGYRGFFLDTLDSYRLAPKFDEQAQRGGLISIIETLHRRFPGIQLILNRGFDIVPAVKDKIAMVAAESLYRGWDAANRRYVEVSPSDRDWLLGQLQAVRDRYGIAVLAIDYVDPADRATARSTADAIRSLGVVPWVADGSLGSLGVGAVEVMPRKMLVLYDSKEAPAINYSVVHRYLAMPLNHLGYVPVYVDINDPLPEEILVGRYAGIVTWFSGYVGPGPRLIAWLKRQSAGGMRIAVFGSFGLALQGQSAQAFGLAAVGAPTGGVLQVVRRNPMLGFETEPQPDRHHLEPLRLAVPDGQPLLQLRDDSGAIFDAAALTAWGGYVLDPFTVIEIPGTDQMRWVVDPFAFLQQALALPEMPVPDVTTENGRRLMFVHIDGDGFPSRAEFSGAPFAGQVLLDEILNKYRIPTTVSVIEAEIAPDGLYPNSSGELEEIARRIFRLPHVEIASHSFSHPFIWDAVKHGIFRNEQLGEEYYHLELPGYKLDLRREILGSADYIRRRLAPANKAVKVFQWSGDAAPGADALALTVQADLLNINGGDTLISRRYPSLAAVAGLGIEKGGVLQVYAPIANENRYTNLWRGPFYAYRNVIETLEMTERPRRLKPIDLYFHVYSASKRASLTALHDVYRWSLAQPTNPIFASEYARKVQDFQTLVIARTADGWLVRSRGEVRTLRAPAALGLPDLSQSNGIGGFNGGGEGNYLHLAAAEAHPRFSKLPATLSYLANANARLEDASRSGNHLVLKLTGHVPLEFALANSAACSVSADGKPIHGRVANDLLQFKLDDAAATIDAFCQAH